MNFTDLGLCPNHLLPSLITHRINFIYSANGLEQNKTKNIRNTL